MADDNLPTQQKIKFVLLGDQGVGKTSILSKFMFETFEPNPNVPIKKLIEFSLQSELTLF